MLSVADFASAAGLLKAAPPSKQAPALMTFPQTSREREW